MFQRRKQGAVDVVNGREPLIGEHLTAAVEVLQQCLADGQPKAVFDLQDVPLINGAGLEMLLDMKDAFEDRAGALKLAAANPLCQSILEVTGVSEQFEVYSDTRTAVGSFIN